MSFARQRLLHYYCKSNVMLPRNKLLHHRIKRTLQQYFTMCFIAAGWNAAAVCHYGTLTKPTVPLPGHHSHTHIGSRDHPNSRETPSLTIRIFPSSTSYCARVIFINATERACDGLQQWDPHNAAQ